VDFRELRDQIEGAISIATLSGARASRIRCPFHNSSGLDMALSHEDGKWRCYGACDDGKWHNIFDWIIAEQGCDFKEAVHHLADMAGISLSPPRERTEILSAAQRYYHSNLLKHPEAVDYLHRRGFSDEHIYQRQFGYATEDFPEGITVRKLASVDLIRTGFYGHYATFRERIVYPVYDNRFNQIQMQGRLIKAVEGTSDRPPPPKYMALSSSAELKGRSIYHCLGGEEILRHKVDHVFLCEGWPDRETLNAWRVPSVCLFGHSGIDRHGYRLKHASRVYVVLDPDEASQKHLLTHLYDLAVKIPHVDFYVVDLATGGMDLNDWAMSGKSAGKFLGPTADEAKVAALYRMAADSKHFVQDLIDRWGDHTNLIDPLVKLIARTSDPDRWSWALAQKVGQSQQTINYLIKVLAPSTEASTRT
jgi:DNA primase